MSELADRERGLRRAWAAPGRSHDHVIRFLKIALPAAIGVILAFLAFAPLEDKQEVSFLLDKNKVGRAEESMRVEAAQYRGQDNEGRPFVLNARNALQHSSAVPIVDVNGMSAELDLENGPARLQANQARYNMDTDRVAVPGAVLLTTADGYRLGTSDVLIDLKQRRLAGRGGVQGQMPLGRFSAERLDVDIAERTVTLSGRARVHIVQGGAR